MSVHFENIRDEIDQVISSISLAQETISKIGSDNSVLSLARLEKEMKKLRFEAINLNRATQNVSFGQLFELDLSNIFAMYVNQYQLIKEEIETLTRKLISGNLDNEERKSIEAILEAYNALADQMDSITQEITGTTVKSLSESIAEAFLNGEDAAEAWGDKVNDIIKRILIQQLSVKYLTGPVQSALDTLMKNTADGLEPWEADLFKLQIQTLADSVGPAFDAARNALKTIGVELTPSTTDTKGMTGAIQNITEETAGLIAGQFSAIRVDVKAIIMEVAKGQLIMDQGLSYLSEIARNTRHNEKLNNISAGIDEMNRIMKERL
jgi:hypothetical protein